MSFKEGQVMVQNKNTRMCALHKKIHIPPVIIITAGERVFFMFLNKFLRDAGIGDMPLFDNTLPHGGENNMVMRSASS